MGNPLETNSTPHNWRGPTEMTRVFKENSSYRALFLSLVMSAIGYGLYKGVFDNYLVESVGMGEFGKGVTEFFRESAGLMLVFILALLYRFSAPQIFKLGGLLMLVGMIMQSAIPASKVLVTIAILIYSTGEHIQIGMKNTLTLEYSRDGRSGVALGWLNAVTQFGNLAGYLLVIPAFLLAGAALNGSTLFKWYFVVSSLFMGLALIAAMKLRGASRTSASQSRFYFRRKFTKYYMLELFYGARKQVFFTFGPYVLVLFYGAQASTVSGLFAISAVACLVFSPLMGKLIDRVGYKPVMIADTLILVIVCFFYGFAHHLFSMRVAFVVCCVNYVLDSVISLAAMAANVYVQELSESGEEMRATISTGVSVNHLVTVLVALFGGWIWSTLGVETLFVLSAVLGLCNSAFAATIRVPKKDDAV